MKKKALPKWGYDVALGAGVLLVDIIAIAYSYFIQSPREDLFLARPDTYMGLWFGIMGILAIMLIFRGLKQKAMPEGQEPGEPIWCGMGVFTAVVLFLYLITLKKLGFVLGSTLMLWVLTLAYTFNIGEVKKDWHDKKLFVKELVKTGVFSILSSYITFYIFTNILTSKLPTFSLF